MQPQPTEKEIQFILDAIAEYLTVKARLNLLPSYLKLGVFLCMEPVPVNGAITCASLRLIHGREHSVR